MGFSGYIDLTGQSGEVQRLGPLLGIYSGFGPISAVSDPPRVIPSHVWMIRDPSWGSWGRFDDFSHFELFLERIYAVVTQENTKMAKIDQNRPSVGPTAKC